MRRAVDRDRDVAASPVDGGYEVLRGRHRREEQAGIDEGVEDPCDRRAREEEGERRDLSPAFLKNKISATRQVT